MQTLLVHLDKERAGGQETSSASGYNKHTSVLKQAEHLSKSPVFVWLVGKQVARLRTAAQAQVITEVTKSSHLHKQPNPKHRNQSHHG